MWPLLFWSCIAARAPAQPLVAMSHSVQADERARVVRIEIVYDHAPDFFTLDAWQRPTDSFQVHLDTEPGNQGLRGLSPHPWEFIVRGDEIHINGDIPVRDHVHGPSEAPWSGGWGPVVGSVPFVLTGETLRFEIPYSMLSIASGPVPYCLEVYHYGSLTDRWDTPAGAPAGQGTPLPSKPDSPRGHKSATSLDALFQSAAMSIALPVGLAVLAMIIRPRDKSARNVRRRGARIA